MKNWKNWLGVILGTLGTALINGGAGWIDIVGNALTIAGAWLVSNSVPAAAVDALTKVATKAGSKVKMLAFGLALVCAIPTMAGCSTVGRVVETAGDWRQAGRDAMLSVYAFEQQEAVTAVDVAGWTDAEIRDAALRDGVAAFAYGAMAAKSQGETDPTRMARYGVQVALYWVRGRYPDLRPGWVDLLLENRSTVERGLSALGNESLSNIAAELFDWIDAQPRATVRMQLLRAEPNLP